MIELIATDLDGTLFKPKRRVKVLCNKNRIFLNEFLNNGGKVALVSGRSSRIKYLVDSVLEKKVDMIGCNGGFLIHNEEMIVENVISKTEAKNLYEKLGSDHGIIAWSIFDNTDAMRISPTDICPWYMTFVMKLVNHFNGVYRENYEMEHNSYLKSVDIKDSKIYKIMIVFGVSKKAVNKAHKFYLKFKDDFPGVQMAWSRGTIEVTAPGATKASCLIKLCQVMNIKEENVAVVGDSGNDIELFKAFDNSFVMKGVDSRVTSEAKNIIGSVSDLKNYL